MKIVTNKKDSSQRNKLGGFEMFQKNETEGFSWKCMQLLVVQTDYQRFDSVWIMKFWKI